MRKITSVLLVACLLAGLTACGRRSPDIREALPSSTAESSTVDAGFSGESASSRSIKEASSRQSEASSSEAVGRVSSDAAPDASAGTYSNSQPEKEPVTQQKTPAVSSSSAESPAEANSMLSDEERFGPDSDLHAKYPVRGEREWVFYSTNPSNRHPECPYDYDGLLTAYRFQIAEDDATKITCEYYIPLNEYTGERYDSDTVITVGGLDYLWQMTSYYDGWCFPMYGGSVEIGLRCYDSFGNFLSDDLTFDREGPDTMILTKNSGTALQLNPGDTFTR